VLLPASSLLRYVGYDCNLLITPNLIVHRSNLPANAAVFAHYCSTPFCLYSSDCRLLLLIPLANVVVLAGLPFWYISSSTFHPPSHTDRHFRPHLEGLCKLNKLSHLANIFNMLKHLFTKANGLGQTSRLGAQSRFLATVQTNTPRRVPEIRPRRTPVSHERATLTIKVIAINWCVNCAC
jgi:hypothetical protein